VLLCVIWLAVWQQVETERDAQERDIAQDTANLALVFEQNVSRTASEIDRILKFLRQSYERSGFKALGDYLARRFALEHIFIDCPNPI